MKSGEYLAKLWAREECPVYWTDGVMLELIWKRTFCKDFV